MADNVAGATLSKCTDLVLWDSFVTASPQGSVYCRSAFIGSLGVDFDLWFLHSAERIEAGAVILMGDGQPLPAPYPYCMYQGILLHPWGAAQLPHRQAKWELETLSRLIEELAQHYSTLSFSLHSDIKDLRAFQWFHFHEPEKGQFELKLRYTAHIDLRPTLANPDFMTNMRHGRRYDYKQAKKLGIQLDISDDVEILHNLHLMTLDRQNVGYDSEYSNLLRTIASGAIKGGYGELGVCRTPDGAPISAGLFLFDERIAYYAMAGNDPTYRSTGAGTFLVCEMARRAVARKLWSIDLCGVNSPQRGDFKISLNATVKPYYDVAWPNRIKVPLAAASN